MPNRREGNIGTPPIVAVCGAKNAGKTSLLENLLPALVRRGLCVVVIKHDGHRFDPDREGTDTFRLLSAGAAGAAVYDGERFQAVKYAAVTERELAALFPEADLILLEGGKGSEWPKIEVLRGGSPVSDPATRIALVTDGPCSVGGAPVFSPDDAEGLAAFLLACTRGERQVP